MDNDQLNRIRIRFTTKDIFSTRIRITKENNHELELRTRPCLPRLVRDYKKQICNSSQNQVFNRYELNRKAARSIARQLLTNPLSIIVEIFGAKKSEFFMKENNSILKNVSFIRNDKPIWYSRESTKFGLKPHTFSSSLEYDRITDYNKFQAFIWVFENENLGTDNVLDGNCITKDIAKVSEEALSKNLSEQNFGYVVHKLSNIEIYHGEVAISGNRVYPVSDRDLLNSNYWPSEYLRKENCNSIIFYKKYYQEIIASKIIFVGSSDNWFHFLFECGLRLVQLEEDAYQEHKIVARVTAPRQILEFITVLTGQEILLLDYYCKLEAKEGIVVTDIGFTGFVSTFGKVQELEKLRSRVLNKIVKDSHPHRKIFIMRKKNTFRPLHNRNRFISYLISQDFEVIDPECLSATDQIMAFANAKIIVGESGAALTNLLFCHPQCFIIELQPPNSHSSFLWKDISAITGAKHEIIFGKNRKLGDFGFASDGFEVDIKNLKKTMAKFEVSTE